MLPRFGVGLALSVTRAIVLAVVLGLPGAPHGGRRRSQREIVTTIGIAVLAVEANTRVAADLPRAPSPKVSPGPSRHANRDIRHAPEGRAAGDGWSVPRQEIFGDEVVTATVIDRLAHHAEILSLMGDSYRLSSSPGRITRSRLSQP